MYGYVYKTTNTVNGKIYVGQHRAFEFQGKRYMGSGTVLLSAIKKYRKSAFTVELLEAAESKEELDKKERYWIQALNATDCRVGYNLLPGGQGSHFQTEESKRKISDASKGRKVSDETRKKISESLTGRKGHSWTQGQRAAIMRSLVGRKKSDLELSRLKAAYDKEKHRTFCHKTKVICIETGVVFDSIKEARLYVGGVGDIQACCSGKQKKAAGYHWQYYREE